MAHDTSEAAMQSTNNEGGFYDVYDDNNGGLHVEGAKQDEQVSHNDKPACEDGEIPDDKAPQLGQSHKPAEVTLGFWREGLCVYEFDWHDNILGCVGDSLIPSVWDVVVKELLEFSSPPVHPNLCPLAVELMQSFKNPSIQLPLSLAHAWDLVLGSPTSLQDHLPSLMFMVCKYEAAPKEYYYELVSTEILPTFGDT
ncbi:hypothetical protein M422DRAFT_245614 [Sphaerobolus stellatus SS14]|nr:hypothetical protein M422DRAFT_245614 [Sphaerobolus stellatus SS14]